MQLQSGAVLDADIVLMATGLKVKMLGGNHIYVDGAPQKLSEMVIYKGSMFSGNHS
jgi:monooxygenase